jgi:hypothetical protein
MGPNCLGTVGSKRGGAYPVIRDRHLVSKGARERGGTKTVGVPEYVLTVENIPEPPSPPPPPPPPPTPPSAPGVAVLVSPANGATNLFYDSVVLSWESGGDTESFSLWINGAYRGRVFSNSITVSGLSGSTDYSWRVDSIGPGGVTEGTTWEFSTSAFPYPIYPKKAVNPTPANHATGVAVGALTVSWQSGGDTLSYDVYKNGVFQGNQSGTSASFGVLSYGETVVWRVDSVNTFGTTTGDTWSFSSPATSPLPNKPVSPSPANGSTDLDPTSTTVSWANGGGATSYDVYINGVFQVNQAGTSYNPGTLTSFASYTWRVDAVNAAGTTTGDTWSFTTTGHATVVTWAAQVVTNGGAAPAAATKQALSTFCYGMDSNSLTALMKSVCCFVPDSLTAALTPLIFATGNSLWVNHNFLAGDLSVVGLKGNGSNKYLETGVIPATAWSPTTSSGITMYVSVADNSVTNIDVGASEDGTNLVELVTADGGFIDWDSYNNSAARIHYASGPFNGYISGNRTASNATALYMANSGTAHSAVVTGSSAGGTCPTTKQLFAFANNLVGNPQLPSKNRMSFVAVHKGLSSAQSLAFFNLIQAMRTALGGGYA